MYKQLNKNNIHILSMKEGSHQIHPDNGRILEVYKRLQHEFSHESPRLWTVLVDLQIRRHH